MTKRVRVTLVGIKVVDPRGDSGNDLEIFGNLYAQVFSTNGPDHVVQTERFWSADNDHYLTIHEATMFELHVHKEMIIQQGEILILFGGLRDEDTVGSDDLGNPELRIPYDAIGNSTYDLPFDASGGVVQARYSTTVL